MGKKHEFSKDEINFIINEYKNGKSRRQLKLIFGVSDKVILRILKENNINIRGIQEANSTKYFINKDFFNPTKFSADTAYILGLFASDGYVCTNGNQCGIELQEQDGAILDKINQVLQNERPVKSYINYSHNKEYHCKKLYFENKQLKNDLMYYNILPQKTYTCVNKNFMENIPDEYKFDFIRGMTDGDGCFTFGPKSTSPKWYICGSSITTLLAIQDFLENNNISTTISLENKKDRNLQLYRVYCYSKEKIKKIYEKFYYPTVNLFLERKRKIAYNIIKE